MSDAISWWLALQVLGLAALPPAWVVMRSLPDRGWAFAKILGLLLAGYCAWLPGMLRLAPFDRSLNLLALLLLLAFSSWLLLSRGRALLREIFSSCRAQVAYILAAELLFTLAFAGWAILRACDPAIYGTEKFMDFAFLNSLVRGGQLPPHDPWLIGYAINYYYFGYSLMASLTHLSGVDSAIGYNLANVTLFSLTVLGAFGLVYNLAAGDGRRETGGGRREAGGGDRVEEAQAKLTEDQLEEEPGGRLAHPRAGGTRAAAIGAGLLGALLVAVAGNLASVEQVFGRGATGDTFDWWSPSRVVRDAGAPVPETINEFPVFSFILGDLHPHVMALPLVLLVLALALALLRGTLAAARQPGYGGLPPLDGPGSGAIAGRLRLFVVALAAGSLYAANTWDYPTYLLIVLVALGLPLLSPSGAAPPSAPPAEHDSFGAHARYWLRGRAGAWAARAASSIALSLLLFLPFHLTFSSPVGAPRIPLPPALLEIPILGRLAEFLVGFVGLNIWPKTWEGFVTIFGVFLYALLAMLLAMLSGPRRRQAPAREHQPAPVETALGLPAWLLVGSVVAILLAALLNFPLLALLVPLLLASLHLIGERLRRPGGSPAELFVLTLVATGAAISLGTELVFLQDAFHGRMNTLFKFYYQVWVLWAIAAAYASWWLLHRTLSGRGESPAAASRRPAAGRLYLPVAATWATGMVALLFLALLYVAYAPAARGGLSWLPFVAAGPRSLQGLDGTAYLGSSAPGDLAAIRWLRENAPAGEGIAEAPGAEYNLRGMHGRVSAFTGMPTIIAWPGHERQWRGGQPAAYAQLSAREADLDLLYSTTDPSTARDIIRKYGLRYVFVGTIEKGEQGTTSAGVPLDYGRPALAKFAQFMDPAFRSEPANPDPLAGTTVYRLRDD